MADQHNRAGRLTNPPQHNPGAYGEGKREQRAPDGLPTRADPHPPEEENPYRAKHPGGARTKHDINRVNNAVTDGSPEPRPRNAESGRTSTPGS